MTSALRARSIVLPVVVATVAFARGAHADVDPTETFEWNAPEGCPSEGAVKDSIRTLVRAGTTPVRAHAVATGGPPWTARIRIEQADELGERTLEASSCDALGQAVALVVALAIDRAEPAPPRDRVPAPAPSTSSTSASATEADMGTKPRSARHDRLATHAGLAARTGLLPSLAPGIEIGASWTEGALELGARGALFARSSASVRAAGDDGADTATGTFLLATIEARGAWVLRASSAVRVAPFGGVGLAWLRGEGHGAAVAQAASDWLPVPFAGAEARARLGHGLEPYISIDGGLPFGRSSFRFHGASAAVFEPAAVSVRAGAGVRLLLF